MARLEKLQQLLARNPDDVFLNFSLAMEYVAAGNEHDALRQFDRTIELDAAYLPAYQRKGELLIRQKRYDDARASLESAERIAREANDHHMVDNIREMLELLP